MYALKKIHEYTYNCFKSDIPGSALGKSDLWFHLVAQLMLLHGHMDWVLQYEEVWPQPWKKNNFQFFACLQNCIFNIELHTTHVLQEVLTMSPGNNNNPFIYTSIPSRSEENCCVQYPTGLKDCLLSWLLSSLVQVAEKAQGRNACWPSLPNLHNKQWHLWLNLSSKSRLPVISTWALYSQPATPEKGFNRCLICTTSSWTTNCYFWCWWDRQAVTPKTSLTCSFDW